MEPFLKEFGPRRAPRPQNWSAGLRRGLFCGSAIPNQMGSWPGPTGPTQQGLWGSCYPTKTYLIAGSRVLSKPSAHILHIRGSGECGDNPDPPPLCVLQKPTLGFFNSSLRLWCASPPSHLCHSLTLR